MIFQHLQCSNVSMCDLALSLESIRLVVDETMTEKLKAISRTPMYDISSPQMSDSEISTLHVKELSRKLPDFTMPPTEGPAIISEDDWRRMVYERQQAISFATNDEQKKATSHESYLCWQMTPYLQDLFEHVGIVVNSEDYKWVWTYSGDSKNFMKPDFFVALRGLMERKDSSGLSFIKALRLRSSIHFDFGTMPWEIRDCVRVLVEFKNKLVHEHFGKLVLYLQHLSRDSKGCMYYGILCDDTDVILASCCDSELCSRYDLKWTTPGSQAFVRKFISPQNNWMRLLDLSMSHLGVQLEGDNAFLGTGRNGRVFRVQKEGRVLALKIVLTPSDGLVNSVFAEHNILRGLRRRNLPVVTVLDEALAVCENDEHRCLGVCYLMEEVGTPIVVQTFAEIKAVFSLLLALHCQNEFHGDARLSNVICFEEALLWIDFFAPHVHVSNSRDFLRINIIRDIEILTASVSKKYSVLSVAQFQEHVKAYANDPSEQNLALILTMFSERGSGLTDS